MADPPIPIARDVQAEARALLRRWLAADETEVLRAVDTIGRGAIAVAADASARLDRGVAAGEAARQVLQDLERLAGGLEAPPRRAWSLFARERTRAEPAPPTMTALIEQLDRARDSVARGLLEIETDRARLRAAAAGLESALALARACARAVEAAGRELASEQPDRARFLRETVAARLLAREQDIGAQALVTGQAMLTLTVLAESQDALAQALGRARTTTIAALRTATAAREALAGSAGLAARTIAFDRQSAAMEESAEVRAEFHRAVGDAITQARRAIDPPGTAP